MRKHVTLAGLNKAIADVVNADLRLDLPKVWGEGNAVAADGTKYDIYVDNLIAEFHPVRRLRRRRLPPHRR